MNAKSCRTVRVSHVSPLGAGGGETFMECGTLKTGMSVGAKHALVVLAVMLSLGNAKCFASCSPEIAAAGTRSESTKPVRGDCHQHSSTDQKDHQENNRDSHGGGKPHSCLHDALAVATDTYNTFSLSTIGFPAAFAFSASPDCFVPARRLLVSDLSPPPIRLHPNLTIVIRV